MVYGLLMPCIGDVEFYALYILERKIKMLVYLYLQLCVKFEQVKIIDSSVFYNTEGVKKKQVSL